ncbi:SDH family Clp fold serine proteinase, partial [Escherichia coli]
MFEQRKALYAQLEQARNSKVLCYVTGDRPNQEAQISADVFDLFVNHLDVIGDVQKISLVLYTRGGDTLTAWSLVNLLRQFCKELEIIIPSKCHSS